MIKEEWWQLPHACPCLVLCRGMRGNWEQLWPASCIYPSVLFCPARSLLVACEFMPHPQLAFRLRLRDNSPAPPSIEPSPLHYHPCHAIVCCIGALCPCHHRSWHEPRRQLLLLRTMMRPSGSRLPLSASRCACICKRWGRHAQWRLPCAVVGCLCTLQQLGVDLHAGCCASLPGGGVGAGHA